MVGMRKKMIFGAVSCLLLLGVFAILRPGDALEESAGSSVFKLTKQKNTIEELEQRVAKLEQTVANLRMTSNTQTQVKSMNAGADSSEDFSAKSTAEIATKMPVSKEEVVTFSKKWKDNLSNYDSNRDGRLQSGEANLSPEAFHVVDVNGDGTIDQKDIDRLADLMEQAESYASKRDKGDKNYPIEKSEFGGSDQEFNLLDKDRDGYVSEFEYMEFLKYAKSERSRFDIDQDGQITPQELGTSKERFSLLDEDKDGAIETWEVRRAMIKHVW